MVRKMEKSVMKVNAEKRRGKRLKKRCLDAVTRSTSVCVDVVGDRVEQRYRTKETDPKQSVVMAKKEEEEEKKGRACNYENDEVDIS